jgi:hypothetical protein
MIDENSTKEEVLEAVKEDGYALKYASEKMKNDEDVVLEAMKPSEFDFLYYCYGYQPLPFQFASYNIRNNKNIVIKLLKENGLVLEWVSDRLKDDEEVVLEAIKQNCLAIKFASYSVRNNKKIAMIAIKKNGINLSHLSDELKKDKQVVLEAASNFILDKEFMMLAEKKWRDKQEKNLCINCFFTSWGIKNDR